MLFLLFQLGRDRYALDVAQVAEVIPLVQLKALPQAPRGVAGLCNYRGKAVPVIDLSALALDRPARARLSTRLILVRYAAPGGGDELLGLLAEQVTDTIRREPAEFTPAGVDSPEARYLGPVTRDRAGLVQRIEPAQLLTPEVRAVLFQTQTEAGR